MPGELGAHLAGVNGIAAIVTGAIRHIGDLVAIGAGLGHHLVKQITDGMNDVQVLFLVMTADVVGLADGTSGDHGIKRSGVIFHIEPVTDLVTLAVHRQRFAIQRIEDDQRDQLLGEVERAVVVGTVGDYGRQAVSTAPGSHQMVTGSLGGGIWTAGGIGSGFGKERQ